MKFKYPFLKVLREFGRLSRSLTLVGGWAPTVYFEYLWQNQNNPFVTQDVDFALTKDTHWKGLMENLIDQKKFKQRHLKLGKERPYQLLFDNIPIDFLADVDEAAYIQKKILGSSILLNSTHDYQFLLQDKIPITWDGIDFHVPRPARYILHKTSVGLDNIQTRIHDIATAYYVLTRSPEQPQILDELKTLYHDPFYKKLRKKLKSQMDDDKMQLLDQILVLFREVGIYEDTGDVKSELAKLL